MRVNKVADNQPLRPAQAGFDHLSVFKQGPTTELFAVPEDARAMQNRVTDFYGTLKPQNSFHVWLVEQISVVTLQIDRCQRIERRLRDRKALRASTFWDDDRQLEAVKLGGRIAVDPETIARTLEQTPHGCDWMMTRWAMLARVADRDKGWTVEQKALAFDLLGTPAAFRSGEPGEVIDHYGRLIGALTPNAVDLARREVDRLQKRREQVAGLDTLDRSLAESDYRDEPDDEIKQLRRNLATLNQRLKWYMGQLPKQGEHIYPKIGLHPRYLDEPDVEFQRRTPPAPVPTPGYEPTEAEPVGQAEIVEEVKGELLVDDCPILAARRVARGVRAEARRQALAQAQADSQEDRHSA